MTKKENIQIKKVNQTLKTKQWKKNIQKTREYIVQSKDIKSRKKKRKDEIYYESDEETIVSCVDNLQFLRGSFFFSC